MPNVSSAANVQTRRKETDMEKNLLTILYARLSRDDELQGPSNSIINQQEQMQEYAEHNNLKPYRHIHDDGYSGTNWDRPGWQELIAEVEAGRVGTIIVKNLDRMGRDYLRVGLFREMFRERGVRLIAINDNIDSAAGEDDFMPFREIMAEWYARDTSRKIKSVVKAKGNAGKPIASQPPYGYIKCPSDKNKWLVDPEAAAVVKRIFQMTIEGMGPFSIGAQLHDEKVECPSYYLAQRGLGSHKNSYDKDHPYAWSYTNIGQLLSRVEYLGHIANFKGEKPNFKSKKYNRKPREEWVIFENVHEAIITQETFDLVQKLRETTRRTNKRGEVNPLTGILFCSDCGRKLYNKRYEKSDVYMCQTHKLGENKYSELCTPHHIRSVAVREIILDVLRRTGDFVRKYESEFMEIIREKSSVKQGETLKSHKRQITKSQQRIVELDKLITSIYEDKVKGLLSEERFSHMATAYEQEQAGLKEQTAILQSELDTFNATSHNAENFVKLVHRYTRFDELSTVMLNELVDRVIVHEAVWSEGFNNVSRRGMGTRRQHVEVYLKYIGSFDVPDLRTPEEIEAERIAEEDKERKRKVSRENRRRAVERARKKKSEALA